MNTVSQDLAWGIFALLLKLNFLPSLYIWRPSIKKEIEGRIVNQSTLYYVKLYSEQFRKCFYEDTSEVSQKSKDNIHFEQDKNYFYVPIRKIDKTTYNGQVYNFEVEGEHSYLANFVSVANCQNFDISQASKGKKAYVFGNEIVPEDIVNSALISNCKSIAYTYNEPVIAIEFYREIARLAKKKGLKNIFVTNGYWSKESFDYLNKEKLIDAMNIDLKCFDESIHLRYCGAKLKPVLDTIRRAKKSKVHIEITTLIVPGINEDKKQLTGIVNFIVKLDKNIPWHISRFFPRYKMNDKNITSIETLKMAEKIGKDAGLKSVYLGNI